MGVLTGVLRKYVKNTLVFTAEKSFLSPGNCILIPFYHNHMDPSEMITDTLTLVAGAKEILEKTGVGDVIKLGTTSLLGFLKRLFSKNKTATDSLDKFQKDPTSELDKGMLMAFLQTELTASKEEMLQLEKLLADLKGNIEKNDAASLIIKNSKNVVLGGFKNIKGNIHVGDGPQ
jgi:hypothetical protein